MRVPARVPGRRRVWGRTAVHIAALSAIAGIGAVIGGAIGGTLEGSIAGLSIGALVAGVIGATWRSPRERAADDRAERLERKVAELDSPRRIIENEAKLNRWRRYGPQSGSVDR